MTLDPKSHSKNYVRASCNQTICDEWLVTILLDFSFKKVFLYFISVINNFAMTEVILEAQDSP